MQTYWREAMIASITKQCIWGYGVIGVYRLGGACFLIYLLDKTFTTQGHIKTASCKEQG